MRTVSFDVFDTLLTRTCAAPADVFVRLGERLHAAGLTALGALDFATERREAERVAWTQTSPPSEPNLARIYAGLARRLKWDDVQRDAARALEVAVETEGIRAVPAMLAEVAGARLAAGRVLFISDTYLPSALVQSWLEAAGFWRAGDILVVSNEAGESKGNRRLFPQIQRELGLDYAGWTHHGDHFPSDVDHPHSLGVHAEFRPAGRLNAREESLRGPGPVAPSWRSLLAGAARLARLDQPDGEPDPRWATCADVAGPLFYGFVDWCLRETERRGITDLYFLARAGQVFHRIATEIIQARPQAVRLHYLPASRLAFAGADSTDEARLRGLAAPGTAFHCARQTYLHLGLAIEASLVPDWLPRTEWDRNLSAAERLRLSAWLLAPPRRAAATAALAARAQQARAFLATQGLAAGTRAALVDTGWHGSIQHELEILRGAPLTGFYLGNIGAPAQGHGERLGYINQFAPVPLHRDGSYCTLLEIFAPADHGQLLGFAPNPSGRIEPRLALHAPDEAHHALFLQSAALAFCRRALAAGPELHAAPAAELAAVVIRQFTGLHQHPSAAEARAFGRLPHSDQMAEQESAALCPGLSAGAALRAVCRRAHRPVNWWLEGQMALSGNPLFFLYRQLRQLRWRLRGD